MIDTVVLITPKIPKLYIEKIENQFKIFQCIDGKTKKIEYSIVSGNLKGSFDSHIGIRIIDKQYLRIELSLHKLIVGHNIFGGSDELLIQVNVLKKILEQEFQIKLPKARNWEIKKLDYALTFNLGNEDQVKYYIEGLNECYYPQRTVDRYGKTGVYIKGTTTTLKFYDKHEEYNKHDYTRVSKTKGTAYAEKLYSISNGMLRIEVSIKNKKLKSTFKKTRFKKQLKKILDKQIELYGYSSSNTEKELKDYKNKNKVTLKDINMKTIKNIWESEVNKVIRENKNTKVINTAEEVIQQLNKKYSNRNANALYGFWTILSTKGEEHAKNMYPNSTFYRYRDYLISAGISWRNTDVKLIDNSNIIDFVPRLDSKYKYDYNKTSKEFKESLKNLLKKAI